MNNRRKQIYEDYWSYTAAWTDINGGKFINCLKACVHFVDTHNIIEYNGKLYHELQQEIVRMTGIQDVSVRKGINQMVKLGFLKPQLAGYRKETLDFLNAKTDTQRANALSKVVYNYSNFQNSMTDPDANTAGQMRFLLRTLEEVGKLDKDALISLMTADIEEYSRGYLTQAEIDALSKEADDGDFIERKYNQLGHFRRLLSQLDDLQVHDGVIYFKTDAEKLFGSTSAKKAIRDPYLQRVYKSELEEESRIQYDSETPKCMIEGLHYPVLIASHIKPYSHCSDDKEAQFDVNNGLLLSKNIDSLFDLGYITIAHDGLIVCSKVLDEDLKNYLRQYKLAERFMNTKRMDYMEYHRKQVFNKRYRS